MKMPTLGDKIQIFQAENPLESATQYFHLKKGQIRDKIKNIRNNCELQNKWIMVRSKKYFFIQNEKNIKISQILIKLF